MTERTDKPRKEPMVQVTGYCNKCGKPCARKYCSTKCHWEAQVTAEMLVCVQCKKLFPVEVGVLRKYNVVHCSKECQEALLASKRVVRHCRTCGKSLGEQPPSSTRQYCSTECGKGTPVTREERLAYYREYNLTKKAERQAYQKKYKEGKRQLLAEKANKYYASNKDVVGERSRARYAADPSKFKAVQDKVKRLHPDKVKLWAWMKHLKRSAAPGSFTVEDIEALYKVQNAKCANLACCCDISQGYHVDHIYPLSRGGTNWPNNLQLLCAPCNHKKHALDPNEWAARNGILPIYGYPENYCAQLNMYKSKRPESLIGISVTWPEEIQ